MPGTAPPCPATGIQHTVPANGMYYGIRAWYGIPPSNPAVPSSQWIEVSRAVYEGFILTNAIYLNVNNATLLITPVQTDPAPGQLKTLVVSWQCPDITDFCGTVVASENTQIIIPGYARPVGGGFPTFQSICL